MTHTAEGRSVVTGCASIVNPFGETIALHLRLIVVQEVHHDGYSALPIAPSGSDFEAGRSTSLVTLFPCGSRGQSGSRAKRPALHSFGIATSSALRGYRGASRRYRVELFRRNPRQRRYQQSDFLPER